MTLAKKGTRRITVEGIEYCWLVSPDAELNLALVVECVSSKQKIATCVEYGNIISPWLARQAIWYALSKGWHPHNSGQTFCFRFEDITTSDNNLEPLLIRRYREKNYKPVWHLHNLALEQTEVYRGKEKSDDDLDEIPSLYLNNRGEFIVGCRENQIVAIASFRCVSTREAEIERMGVHPDFQRRGYGQQVLEYLEAQAVKLGYKTLSLHMTSIQVAAQRLYVRNCYIESRRKPWRGMERIYFKKQF